MVAVALAKPLMPPPPPRFLALTLPPVLLLLVRTLAEPLKEMSLPP
jgi:hypothetical protein